MAEKAELSNNYISNIENNYSIPSLETLMKICIAFDITPNDILLGTSKEEKTYMLDDLGVLLAKCTPQEKRYIWGIVKVILSERESEV